MDSVEKMWVWVIGLIAGAILGCGLLAHNYYLKTEMSYIESGCIQVKLPGHSCPVWVKPETN